MTETQSNTVRAEAAKLALDNVESEPNIQAVYWLPAEDEVRLIEVDPTFPRSESITPFYFRADPVYGTKYSSGVAMIRPEEVRVLPVPQEWGTWDDAVVIWPESNPPSEA